MSNVYVSDQFQHIAGLGNAVDELSDELDRPIRLIRGRGAQREVDGINDWNDSQIAAADTDSATVRERGLTINSWAALSPVEGTESRQQPQELMNQEQMEVNGYVLDQMYDTLVVSGDSPYDFILLGEVVFGEIVQQALAFHTPLQAMTISNAVNWHALLREPLERCADPEWIAESEERVTNRSRDAFVRISGQRTSLEIRERETRIADAMSRFTEYRREVQQAQAELHDNQRMLDRLLDRGDDMSEDELITEWTRINEHDLVDRSSFSGNTLHVITKDIELTRPDTGESTIVGRFDIGITFGSGADARGGDLINVRNLTNRRAGYDHPHIRGGDFCTGELGDTIYSLLRSRQVGALVNLIIDALGHVTPADDWGRAVRYWFEDSSSTPAEGSPDAEGFDDEA